MISRRTISKHDVPDAKLAALLVRIGSRVQQAGAALVALQDANEQLVRVLLPLILQLADAELAHVPLADSDPVLTFSGSGSSDVVTAGTLRRALAAADEAEEALDALAELGKDD